ncbi:hypothetical protein [Vibrio gallicus]|uniref:hypothetical protein n=1 Tax=Vibrio gallicus TaxID=190897 RepID=UPI0021C28043|nr:hypothetical protein [Vibrio gallicus]
MSQNTHQMALDLLQYHLGLSEEEARKQLGFEDQDTKKLQQRIAQFQEGVEQTH